MDNKELAYVVKEAEKSQDLQSARWRPSRADGIFLSKSKGVRTRRAGGVNSSLSLEAGED